MSFDVKKARQKRIAVILAVGILLSLSAWLILSALENSVSFFYTPDDLLAAQASGTLPDRQIRLGGMVLDGSYVTGADGMTHDFIVTDSIRNLPVHYEGLVPDLFREGQGVVAEGRINTEAVFIADRILAKHDENYMPPELADALEEAERINDDGGTLP